MAVAVHTWAGAGDGALSVTEHDFFESKVRPLLVTHCYECHSVEAAKQKGGLLLDSKHGWEAGGDSGAALVPGDPQQSLIVKAIGYRDSDLKMPPDGRISEQEIAILSRWIALGAPDPRQGVPAPSAVSADDDLDAARSFWAFQPPVSTTGDTIDSLVGEKLISHQLTPAPPAEKRVLARRVYQALHGLPPSPDQLRTFIEDERPDACARLIDRLLASPQYGERWGRHWLDVARYADTNGLDENMAYTSAFRYRDYVIRSFNEDKPYTTFITEQLAGDLAAPHDDPDDSKLIAAGFLSVGPKMLACDDQMKMRMDIVDDQIDTMGRTFLGMTIGCARCHDHKFDPISAADYYGLAGIFKSTTTMTNYKVVAKWHEYDRSPPEVKAMDERIDKLEAEAKKEKDKEAKKKINAQVNALKAKREKRSRRIMAVRDGEPEDTQVHLRGNYLTLGETVPRRFPVALAGESQAPIPQGQSGRLQLAQWIANAKNPLTARVMVNRLWRWHFGEGIVPTPDNFGRLGEAPTNQKLLDHLAVKFMESDWSIKAMHRLIMQSQTYQRSTDYDAKCAAIDPANTSLWRFHRRRLDAEEVRDALLSLSGLLDARMFGQLLTDAHGKYASKGELDNYWKTPRRAVYLPIMRSGVYDAFVAFDFSDPSMINGNRKTSTVAPQSLFMMNGPLVFDAAQAIVTALENASDPIAALYQHILGRVPAADEEQSARQFLDRYPGDDPLQALCRVLLASNEFLYVD